MKGERFGKLVVIDEFPWGSVGKRVECKCDCGNVRTFQYSALKRGNNKTCGECLRNPNYGTRIYRVWQNMKKRCTNPNSPDYKNYGGRGITICDQWHDFMNFYEDMKDTYQEGLTIDRKDNDGNYEPSNCHWTTRKKQNNNRRSSKYVEYKGETMTLAELAEKHDLDYHLVKHRLKLGWSIEDAVEKDIHTKEEITFMGETKEVSEWAKEYGMTYHQLKKRLMRGWDVERAITQPLRKR